MKKLERSQVGFSAKQWMLLLAVLLLIAAIAWGLQPQLQQGIQLLDANTNEKIAFIPIPNNQFQVSFIHSVNNSPVTEAYQIEKNTIFLKECCYSAFGAGMETEITPPLQLNLQPDGTMVVTGYHRQIKNLLYVVGTVSDHVLGVDGTVYSLTALCGKNRQVLLQPEMQLRLKKQSKG